MVIHITQQEAAMIPEFLMSECAGKADVCMGCEHAIRKDRATRRWYITMGHPGFNSKANNADGYRTRGCAVYAMFYFSGKRAA